MKTIIDSIFFSFPIFIIVSLILNIVLSEKGKTINLKIREAVLITLSVTGLVYLTLMIIELIKPFSSGLDEYEGFSALNRATGPYWMIYFFTLITLTIAPQLFWIKKIRNSKFYLWTLAILILIEINFERIIIIMTSLHRDYIPSSWSSYPSYSIALMTWAERLIIFSIIVTIIYFIKRITQHNKG